ncbi:unnamed protein product [Allacma fusca]|uniref:Bestrophin homolog n=1 Tax=Allacma fusca TaxID=39272 RepID=A0A8J2LS66_9HEXA|nr:unnamed protein product [Allacma fusca]
MTVGYTEDVATCRGFGNFLKMLKRWRGSIYKVVWADLIVYLICFYSLNIFYRMYLNHYCEKKKFFIKLITYCDEYAKVVPVSFILSFYVGHIVKRWWNQWMFLPWPDTLAITVSATVDGADERGRLIRRTILRYANVAFVMSLTLNSTLGKLRFPSLTHFVAAGFLNEHEKQILDDMQEKTNHPKYWVPLVWAGTIATRARKEGKIRDDISLNNLLGVLIGFRKFTQEMLNYDWVCIPLVYTQAVTLVVFTYFLSSIVGMQLTIVNKDKGEPVDFYFPFFNFVEFFFYFGWLKVAEVFINPFGIDDDDFEVNWLIDRDFEISYVIVDEMHQEHPNLLKDQYWDDVYPIDLPYTEATMKYKTTEGGQGGSTKDMEVPEEKAVFVRFEEIEETMSILKVHKSKSGSNRKTPGTSSTNSLQDAIRTINSTTRERINSRRGSVGSAVIQTLGVHEAVSHSSVTDHVSSIASNAVPVNAKALVKKGGTVRAGYWMETGGSQVNVEELMEKDDVPYDPSQDERKES